MREGKGAMLPKKRMRLTKRHPSVLNYRRDEVIETTEKDRLAG
jgi:hypothetical protein